MKIIMLTGHSSCGKTTTLNLVYDRINPQGKNDIESKQLLDAGTKDFEYLFTYHSKTIACCTMGDWVYRLIRWIRKYICKPDIFILLCACNDHVLQSKSMQKLIANKEIIYITKTKEPNESLQVIQNQAKADEIIAQLNRLLK